MTKFYFEQNNQIVSVKLQSDDLVNAWSGSVILPKSIQVSNIITADTITEIWQKVPQLEEGQIVFTGGRPNGFKGDGILFQFVVDRGSYFLDFSPDTATYLNDGLGTRSESILESFNYQLASDIPIKVRIDKEPPFSPVVYKDEDFFDGQPVIIFSTRDFESGISHYEIRETTKNGVSNWQNAESPYLINPDVKRIEIKAVDAFDNERIAILNIKPEFLALKLVILGIIFLGLIFLGYNLIKRWKKRLKS